MDQRRTRSRSWRAAQLALALVGVAATLVSPGATRPASAAVPVGASRYTTVAPTRLADTRSSFGAVPAGRVPAGGTITVQVTGRPEVAIPAGASGVVLGIVAVRAGVGSYVTVWPSDQPQPDASNLNVARPGATVADMVTTRLAADGRVSLFSSLASDLVVDVYGYYTTVGGATARGRTIAISPTRAYDSRATGGAMGAGQTRMIALPGVVPTGAAAAVLNLTVTESAAAGFWTAFPIDAPVGPGGVPFTSNLNVSGKGQTIAVQAIVPIGPERAVKVFSQTGGHVIVDVFGYVTGPTAASSTDGLFVPLPAPLRFADTRNPFNNPIAPGAGPMRPGWTAEIPVLNRAGIPAAVSMIASTTTYVQATWPGYLSVAAAGTPLPATSAVNADTKGQVVANHTMIPVGQRGVAVFSFSGGHLLVDVAGWYTGTPAASTLPTPVNPSDRTACPTIAHIGDSTSVALLNLPKPSDRLDAQYARVGVTSARIEAERSRSIVEIVPGGTNGYDVAQAVRAAGFQGCWVIALGTNDTANVSLGSNRVSRLDRIDRMMSVIGTEPVAWVNVKTLVIDGAYADANMVLWNQALAQAQLKYPNMRIVDLRAQLLPEGFAADGIHSNTIGSQVRARVITDGLAGAFPAS